MGGTEVVVDLAETEVAEVVEAAHEVSYTP